MNLSSRIRNRPSRAHRMKAKLNSPPPARKPARRAARARENASAPVVLAPRAAPTLILVPVDFSDCSHQALQLALTFAHSFHAALVLLYVAENKPAGAEFGASHLPQLESDLRTIGHRQLARLRRQFIPPALKAQTLIRAGRSDVEILKAADALKADLIVMATHSFGNPAGQLGSTTQSVARSAACPVLLVPVAEKCVPFFL